MHGTAYIFINYLQAGRLGHVGWGFSVGDDRYFFGSADHLWVHHSMLSVPAWLDYMSVVPGGNIDWWTQQGSREEMLSIMREGTHIRYHDFKTVSVNTAKPEQAIAEATKLSHEGWDVLRHNCVHQTHQILSLYGAGALLPSSFIPIPRVWFGGITGPPQFLRDHDRL